MAPRTVGKWYESGALPGWRLPIVGKGLGGDRRFSVDAVIAFCREYSVPIPPELKFWYYPIVTVGLPAADAAALGEGVLVLDGLYEAGARIPSVKPDVVVIDTARLGLDGTESLAHALIWLPRIPRLIGLLAEDGSGRGLCEKLCFEAVLVRPFDLATLAAMLV